MKKFFILFAAVGILFASNQDINKKLDILLEKLDTLEKKLDEKDKEIEKLKKELQKQQKELNTQKIETKKEFAIKSCDNLKVTSFSYNYHDNVLPYITFRVTLKNNYPYEIKKISGNLYFDDKDGTTLIKHYLKRDVDIKPYSSVTIEGEHMVINEIEKEIKDEKPNDLKVYFSPTIIYFKNNQEVKCY